MQIPYFKSFRHICKNSKGFNLVEVMVVMIIVAILATGVVFMFANPSARVKSQAFTMLGDLNFARSEAVNRNLDVLVYFLDDVSEECRDDIAKCADTGKFDGYLICLDEEPDNDCDTADTIIRTVLFNEKIQLYDISALGGPDKKPDTEPCNGDDKNLVMTDSSPDVDGDNDGITFKGSDGAFYNSFYFNPMGISIANINSTPEAKLVDIIDDTPDNESTYGYVILYYAASAKHYNKSYSLMFGSSLGNLKILRWANSCWDER